MSARPALPPATRAGFAVAGILLVAAGLGALWEHRAASASGDWSLSTLRVLAQAKTVLVRLVDAETGQRGYLLTGVEEYLAPYVDAIARLPRDVDSLCTSTRENPEQHERCATLRELVLEKLAELERTVELRRHDGVDAALAVVQTHDGKRTMERIRGVLAGIEYAERDLLERRLDAWRSRGGRTTLLVGAATALGYLVGLLSLVMLDRDGRRRLRAEARLRESEARLQITLASIGDAVIATDATGAVGFMNPVAQALTGWSDADARGRHLDEIFRIVHEETRATVESPVAKVLRLGTVVGLANHTVLLARDGRAVPIDDSGAPIRDADGTVLGVVLVFRDVTAHQAAEREHERAQQLERERAERAHAERRWRELAESLPQLVWTCRPDGPCEYLSRQWLEYTGRPEAEQLGVGWLEAVHPDDRDETMARWNASCRAGEAFATEHRLRRHDGVHRWFAARAVPLHADGTIVRWFGSSTDIDDRRRAEDALRASEERFQQLARAVEETFWIVDPAGPRVVYVSPAFERVWQRPAADLEAAWCTWLESVHPDDRGHATAAVALAPDATRDEITYRILRPDGDVRRIRHRVARMANGLVAGVASDVTDRERTEAEREDLLRIAERARAEAEAANLAKDQFLAVLSHELRSPLSAMTGWVTLLKRGTQSEALVARAVETLERNLELQAQLVNDLLDVSRIVSGKLPLERAPVDVGSVVATAVDDARPAAEAKGIALSCTVTSLDGHVVGDAKRLEQVMTNLLTNAVKFTPEGGRVTVALRRDGEEAVLAVADTGIGIAPAFLPHVFERFRQADSSRTRHHGGLGLGLSIVRHIVEMHGGRVAVHSDGEDRGTTFTVRIPLRGGAPAPPRRPAAAEPEVGLHGLSVLVVEDEADTRSALAQLLEIAGARVTAVASSSAGIDAYVDARPDVIVSDLGMPGESGHAFLRRVRGLDGRYVPAIALSGFASKDDRDEATAAGFDEHLAKPVDPRTLIARIRRMARDAAG